jgi:hypothetical protein
VISEQAEHDGPDKGKCGIRGENAQSADERSDRCHWVVSPVHVAARVTKFSKGFGPEKVSAAVLRVRCIPGGVVKES